MKKPKERIAQLAEPLAGLLFTTIFFILVNLYYKSISFLTTDFEQILPLYNTSLVVGIAFHAARLFIRSKYFKAVADVVNLAFFIGIAIQFWQIFPFDTSVIGDKNTWDTIFKFLIVAPPLLTLLGTLVGIVKLFNPNSSKDSE